MLSSLFSLFCIFIALAHPLEGASWLDECETKDIEAKANVTINNSAYGVYFCDSNESFGCLHQSVCLNDTVGNVTYFGAIQKNDSNSTCLKFRDGTRTAIITLVCSSLTSQLTVMGNQTLNHLTLSLSGEDACLSSNSSITITPSTSSVATIGSAASPTNTTSTTSTTTTSTASTTTTSTASTTTTSTTSTTSIKSTSSTGSTNSSSTSMMTTMSTMNVESSTITIEPSSSFMWSSIDTESVSSSLMYSSSISSSGLVSSSIFTEYSPSFTFSSMPSITMPSITMTSIWMTSTMESFSITSTMQSHNSFIPATTTSSLPTSIPTPSSSPSLSATDKILITAFVSIPCTAIITVLVMLLFCYCCKKKGRSRSTYVRLAPTVFFDDEDS